MFWLPSAKIGDSKVPLSFALSALVESVDVAVKAQETTATPATT